MSIATGTRRKLDQGLSTDIGLIHIVQFNILYNYQKGYICHPILGVRMGIQGHMKRSQMGHIKDPLMGQSEDPLEGQSKDPLVGRIKDPIFNNCTPYYVIFVM